MVERAACPGEAGEGEDGAGVGTEPTVMKGLSPGGCTCPGGLFVYSTGSQQAPTLCCCSSLAPDSSLIWSEIQRKRKKQAQQAQNPRLAYAAVGSTDEQGGLCMDCAGEGETETQDLILGETRPLAICSHRKKVLTFFHLIFFHDIIYTQWRECPDPFVWSHGSD